MLADKALSQQQLLILYGDGTQSHYTMQFADEFNGEILDQKKWLTSYPWGRHLTGNTPEEESLEYYTDGKNSTLHKGILSLTAKKERTCGNCESWIDSAARNKNGELNFRCFDYSSGMIYSKEAYGFGFYEIRFKQSLNSNGMWPAFWLFGNDNEIDVFENKGERSSETHWDLHCKGGCTKNYGGWKKVKTNFTGRFNTISFAWTSEKQRWFCNGSNYVTQSQAYQGDMHIIANNAVSRNRKGKGFWVGTDESTVFPSALEIDYIRYFKNNYNGRKWKYLPNDEDLLKQLTSSQKPDLLNHSVNTRSNQLITVYIDFEKHQLTYHYYGKQSKQGAVAIYDSSGKLIKRQMTGEKNINIDQLPDESIIVIARAGKKILAERVEVKR